MRSGFLALCGVLALLIPGLLRGQGAVAPTFVSQPVPVNVFVGEPVQLSVTVDGTAPITFQWFKDGVLIPVATNATATSATFSIFSSALTDTAAYYVTASNSAGTVFSLPVLVSVGKRPQIITFNAPTAAVAAGSGVALTATSSSSLPITFEIVSGTGSLGGGNILTSPGGSVVVRASQAGNAAFAAAEPISRTITFVAGALSPFITSPPVDQTVTAGASATLRVSAIGTPAPTYQWQKDGTDLAGATGSALTLAAVTLADTARYTVVATNLVGNASATAALTVQAAPVFTTQPASQTVFAGEPVTFTAAVTGFPTPTFQWRKNGTALAGATAATLRLASPVAIDAARYDVVATNALGTATSAAATLTVTTRDFSGAYFGTITATGSTAGSGSFALLVRANRTAVFLGNLGTTAALIVPDLVIDLTGGFSRRVTLGPLSATLRGSVDDATGEFTATLAEASATLTGTRAARTGPADTVAGLYQLVLVGSATGRGYVLLAADGQAYLLTADATGADSARGTLGANGRLAFTTTASQAVLDLAFSNGALTGTVRAGGTTGTVAGAIETLLGREHLTNLSVRCLAQNAAPLITGFVVAGTTPKQVLIRAAGPTLAQAPFNLAGALADPTLQVLRGNLVVAQNDEWGTPAANGAAVTAATARTGAFAFRTGSADAALVTTLPPGPYTVQIGGGNGTVLAEIYEVLENNEAPGVRRLVNTSARGLVAPGSPLIAGFVIAGTAPQRVLIRGIGAALGAPPFNVPGALPNPQLTLFRGSTALKTNDDWFRDPEAATIRDAATRAGAFALGAQSADAAILIYLEPGAYTAQVSGPTNANANNSTGIALVEVYESTAP